MSSSPNDAAPSRTPPRSRGPQIQLAVIAESTDQADVARAVSLAGELSLPLIESTAKASRNNGRCTEDPDLLLVVGTERLELRLNRPRSRGVYVDFVGGATGYRRRSGVTRRQPLARAVGIRGDAPSVVDATAGLAGDAFLLCCLGCTVVAVERSPVLGRLIQDGLERALKSSVPVLIEVLERMTLVVDDSRIVLRGWRGDRPDVVYMDPMYPLEAKRSPAKKEMQICRLLVGDDADAGELLAVARDTARLRVVVKRPRHAPPLAAEPDVRYLSKLVRYDVYLAVGKRANA